MKNILLVTLLAVCCAFAAENVPLPGLVLRVSFDKDGAVAEAGSKPVAPISAPDKPIMVPGREGGFA